MEGDVTVRISHSCLNYKDGLALTGKAPVVRRFPMIPDIDFAGVVEASAHPGLKPGNAVLLNGWGTGETHLGSYAERSPRQGRVAGPAAGWPHGRAGDGGGHRGLHGNAALMAIERHGLTPDAGPAIVTGAAGRVGSVAVALLHCAGWPGSLTLPSSMR